MGEGGTDNVDSTLMSVLLLVERSAGRPLEPPRPPAALSSPRANSCGTLRGDSGAVCTTEVPSCTANSLQKRLLHSSLLQYAHPAALPLTRVHHAWVHGSDAARRRTWR